MAPARVEREGTTRRELARGVAWLVPALVVAAAAPAAAASPPCPVVDIVGNFYSDEYDVVTLYNSGTEPIPAGTVITWKIQNVAGQTDTIVEGLSSGVLLTGGVWGPLDDQEMMTFTFTITDPVPTDGDVYWRYGWTDFYYNSETTVTLGGACPSPSACFSDRFDTLGEECPTVGFAAQRSAVSAPARPTGTRRVPGSMAG